MKESLKKTIEEYWLNRLAKLPSPPALPWSEKDCSDAGDVGKRLNLEITSSTSLEIQRICKGSDTARLILFITGLNILLHKYTAASDLITCTGIDSKPLLIRSSVHGFTSVREVIENTKESVLEAFNYSDYSFEEIVDKLKIREKKEELGIYNAAFVYRAIRDKIALLDRFNFIIMLSFEDERFCLKVEFKSTPRFCDIARLFFQNYIEFFNDLQGKLDKAVADLEIISTEEKEMLLYRFNGTEAYYPTNRVTHESFADQAKRTPGNRAVVLADHHITYSELNKMADCFAGYLRKKGVGQDMVVGVMAERSIGMIAAILGILKTGAAYLPIDSNYPQNRVDYMLINSGVEFVATTHSLAGKIRLDPGIIHLDDIAVFTGDETNTVANVSNNVNNIAYIIYTSGSTGAPKGVMIEHRGLINYLCWAVKVYVMDEKVDFPFYSSISFDLTVTSMFTPLLSGNSVIVYPGDDKEFVLEKIVKDNLVGVVKLTPSHLKLLREIDIRSHSSIRRLIVGGEELEMELARDIVQKFNGNIVIYNEYGPTETVVGCMIYRFNGVDETRSVPIGIPADNTQIYILGDSGALVPIGTAGEIHISGDGTARGYINSPDLTAEKFIKNPFDFAQRMYKSGDLARFYKQLSVEFLGRFDKQVKVRGYRVELGEIEHRIKNFGIDSRIHVDMKEIIGKELKEIKRCASCLLPANFPNIVFDENNICNTCRTYQRYENQVRNYFKEQKDFQELLEKTRKNNTSQYDCLLLFSGGKDSTYVLYRLVEMGLKVLTFTFDNGYISRAAFENIKRITSALKVDNIIKHSTKMNEVFVESLKSVFDVCHGCWNALNLIGVQLAVEKGINLVISGLSRGQIFEMRLEGLFRLGIFDDEGIEKHLQLFRKSFFSKDNRYARIIDIDLKEEELENIHFVDYFTYDNTSVLQIKEFLKEKGWVQPEDTGFCSSNCLINDVGIYIFLKAAGYHFYANQLSWDIRLGSISREEGYKDIDFTGDPETIKKILEEIGYYDTPVIKDVVVLDRHDKAGNTYLCAYIVLARLYDQRQVKYDFSELKKYLSLKLPDYMAPSYFVEIEEIPLTANGKIDRELLPDPEINSVGKYAAPRNEVEEMLAEIWKQIFESERIGIDDNFFMLGGDSIKSIQAAARMKKVGYIIEMRDIFRYPTIEQLAPHLKKMGAGEKPPKEQAPIPGELVDSWISIIEVDKLKQRYALENIYMCTPLQEGMLFHSLYEPTKNAYFLQVSYNLYGRLDIETVKLSLQELFKHYDILRTIFIYEGLQRPLQVVLKEKTIEFYYKDSRELTDKEQAEFIDNYMLNDRLKLFNLDKDALARLAVIQVKDTCFKLVWSWHHIILDGWSVGLINRDFFEIYKNIKKNISYRLPESRPYREYIEWLMRQDHEKSRNYWENYLTGYEETASIPIGGINRKDEYKQEKISFSLVEEVSESIKSIGVRYRATLNTVIQTCWGIMLSKYCNKRDVVFGSVVSGRPADFEGVDEIVGLFINTIPVRVQYDERTKFKDLLEKVQDEALNSECHHFFSLVEIQKESELGQRLFDHIIAFENYPLSEQIEILNEHEEQGKREFGFKISGVEEWGQTNFNLDLVITPGKQLKIEIFYNSNLYEKAFISRIGVHFNEICRRVIKDEELCIDELSFISDQEKERQLFEFNKTTVEFPGERTIHDLFEEQAERSLNNTAVISDKNQITYKELDKRTNRLANVLTAHGIRAQTIAAVLLERSVEMIISIFAILKAGGAYMPLSLDYPGARVRYILEDSNTSVLVTDRQIEIGGKTRCDVIDIRDEFLNIGNDGNPGIAGAAINPAYVIYTSGSTGKPKGVLVQHGSLANRLNWMQKKYPIGNNDTILQKTTVAFDVSVWEIFWWALVGARVCMLLPGGEKNPAQIVDTIEKRKISIIHFVPSMLNTFLDYVKFTGKIAGISSLRQVIASGEPLLPSQVQRFKEVIYDPNLTGLANLYGPTEATIDVTYFDCFTGDNPERVPIGKPIDNIQLYIVNENRDLQPIGIVGELCIAGVGLARGYINNEELNIEKFVHNPFTPGERMYKTGDLARWLNDGNIEFIGRIDAQVKVRGFRIELAEIESKLLEHERVKEAVILAKSKGSRDGDKDLFAYIVSDETLSKTELREYLAGKLPYYMIPSHFARIDRIPLTTNGKIDRRALEEQGENMGLNSKLVKPRNNIEKLISEAWQEVLHADKLSVNDNFFDLGGTSIDMINLSWRLKEILKIDNILMEMFKYPTIRLFAEYVARQHGTPGKKKKDMVQMEISLDDVKTGREKQRSKRRLSIQ